MVNFTFLLGACYAWVNQFSDFFGLIIKAQTLRLRVVCLASQLALSFETLIFAVTDNVSRCMYIKGVNFCLNSFCSRSLAFLNFCNHHVCAMFLYIICNVTLYHGIAMAVNHNFKH